MLVIIEKPSLVQGLDPALRKAFPNESLQYVVANRFGTPFVYDYPRKLRWAEYPVVRQASYSLAPERQLAVELGPNARVQRQPVQYASLAKGQKAISCTDCSSGAVAAALRLRDHLAQTGAIEDWEGAFTLKGLAPGDAEAVLKAPLTQEAALLACARAALKADFDYSFLVNAAGLLTPCYQAAGGQFTAPVISKFTIQALFALRRDLEAGLRTAPGLLVARFHNWQGTGRYASQRASLGSCSSQAELLDTLVRYGLAEQPEEPGAGGADCADVSGDLRLTSVGAAFLEKLHPDCEDPDLPFRLQQWQETPTAESQLASQRYLRTWFGKQKRYMDRGAPR